jgi:uncharacterized membrane protein YeaQ/YmgE (transglycosylase-associated protein family)
VPRDAQRKPAMKSRVRSSCRITAVSEPNPYAPPSDQAPPETTKKRRKRGRYAARLDGTLLVVSRDAELPGVCMKCGAHDEIVRRDAKLQWTPVWARFLVFCFIGAILVLLTTKRAQLAIPLCVPCDKRWGTARGVAIGGVVTFLAAFVAMRFSDAGVTGVGLFVATLAAFIVVTVVYVRPRMLQAKRIDDAEITIKGVAPSAAQEIVEGSRARPPSGE